MNYPVKYRAGGDVKNESREINRNATPIGRTPSDRPSRRLGQQAPAHATSGLHFSPTQNIRNALMRNGHDEDSAHALAVAAVERWAAGGDHVHPEVRTASQHAVEEWEKLRAHHP
jgi:hypothetical protein